MGSPHPTASGCSAQGPRVCAAGGAGTRSGGLPHLPRASGAGVWGGTLGRQAGGGPGSASADPERGFLPCACVACRHHHRLPPLPPAVPLRLPPPPTGDGVTLHRPALLYACASLHRKFDVVPASARCHPCRRRSRTSWACWSTSATNRWTMRSRRRRCCRYASLPASPGNACFVPRVFGRVGRGRGGAGGAAAAGARGEREQTQRRVCVALPSNAGGAQAAPCRRHPPTRRQFACCARCRSSLLCVVVPLYCQESADGCKNLGRPSGPADVSCFTCQPLSRRQQDLAGVLQEAAEAAGGQLRQVEPGGAGFQLPAAFGAQHRAVQYVQLMAALLEQAG